jgi:hypothetical protein
VRTDGMAALKKENFPGPQASAAADAGCAADEPELVPTDS